MKNDSITIARKELYRFLKDKKLFFTIVILPGLMIFCLYSIVGILFNNVFSSSGNETYMIQVMNLPDSIEKIFNENDMLKITDVNDIDIAKESVESGESDALIVFPTDMDMHISRQVQNIAIYYNSQNTTSSEAYSVVVSVLNSYEDAINNIIDINALDENYDLATEKDKTGKYFSLFLPMLLMMLLFNTCTSIAPDAIAGEKDRGTIATLLVTPIKRKSIALGKILSLSIIVLLSGISSFIGIVFSLPFLLNNRENNVNLSYYHFMDYFWLLLIVVSTVLVMISITAIISAFSKSIREASTTLTPISIFVGLIGLSSMYIPEYLKGLKILYLIPLFNSSQCMNSIFLFEINKWECIITVLANNFITFILVGALSKIFESERIML